MSSGKKIKKLDSKAYLLSCGVLATENSVRVIDPVGRLKRKSKKTKAILKEAVRIQETLEK